MTSPFLLKRLRIRERKGCEKMTASFTILRRPQMPYVNIKLTGDEEAPTDEEKRQLIEGVTELVGRVLGKNTDNMVVIIEEIPMANYGIGGKTVRARRAEAKLKAGK